jgi:hypothetical protein
MAETVDRDKVIAAIRSKYPEASMGEISQIALTIRTQQDLDDFKQTQLVIANSNMFNIPVSAGATATIDPISKSTGAAKVMDEILLNGIMLVGPGKFVKGFKLAGTAAKSGGSALTKLASTLIPRTATGKVAKKKVAKRAAVLGAAGWAINTFGGDAGTEVDASVPEQVADQNLLMALGQYQMQGGDVNALANTPAGQQLFQQGGLDPALLGVSGNMPMLSGVYVGSTGKTTATGPKIPFKTGLAQAQTPVETISMADWKNKFPIADPVELQKWKSQLVSAGVVEASAGLGELQKQWEAWGDFSQQMYRQGKKLSPTDLLNIQRGLWGGGGGGGPSYSVNLMKKENAVALFKQAMEAYTGRIVSDEEAASFAKSVEAKQLATPTKTETKMVKGKKVTVTSQGFGEAEAAKLAQQQAKKDPMFEEFQTAEVFGSALEKALGVRG